MSELVRLFVHNYRGLRDVDFATSGINVLFGPNGVGKSTFLDALWFVRECASRGVAEAASSRHHGIGLLSDNAEPGDEKIHIGIGTRVADYVITFSYSSGRIEPFVGERLLSRSRKIALVNRLVGGDRAEFYHEQMQQTVPIKLRDPEKLAFSNYLLFSDPGHEALGIDSLLKSLHFYASRAINMHQLRVFGSESSVHTYPWERWQNLWSALRNLNNRRAVDDRFDTIIAYMRKAFPGTFKDLVFEPLGADRVGCSFVEHGRKSPIQASGVSDGHIQLLGLLTALFGDARDRPSLLLFDEPETSLHPHAIAVFAEAACEASANWSRQIFVATHSPVLISQFAAEDVVVAEAGQDRSTKLRRVSEIAEIHDLLEQYSVGSLYMSENVGQQGMSGDWGAKQVVRLMNGNICRFWLIVTGKGEEAFLPELFRGLTAQEICSFQVLRRIGQRNPVTSPERLVKMVRMGQALPPKDVEEIGLPIRARLQQFPGSYAMVVDDLEGSRRDFAKAVYDRYRFVLDTILGPVSLQARASVHFLVNMLEAHYFAHSEAVNSVAGVVVLAGDHPTDVEQIGHPKGELKRRWNEFDEIEHGREIVPRLNLEHVLSRPQECCSLRAMISWCVAKLVESHVVWDDALSSRYRLADGCRCPLTSGQ